jgi:hypothetical protein
MDKIQKQIQDLKNKADSWKLLPVSEKFFAASNKVNCSATYGTSPWHQSLGLFRNCALLAQLTNMPILIVFT